MHSVLNPPNPYTTMSSDLLEVLNVSREGSQSLKAPPKGTKKQKAINRELFNLIGESTPPLAVRSEDPAKFKEKLNNTNKVTPWNLDFFHDTARKDDLKLRHWIRGSGQLTENQPYPFERYNTSLSLPSFTEDEYRQCEQEGKDWSYQETKELFGLCADFDLRWHVIYDRYENKKHRSLEDLKERFYSFSAKVIEHQNKEPDEKTATFLNALKSFNKEHEIERKAHLARLLERSPAEIAEEESLIIEARKFELYAKKTLSERSALLRLLDSPQTSGSINHHMNSQGISQLYASLLSNDNKFKRRKMETPVPPTIPLAAASNPNAYLNGSKKRLNSRQLLGRLDPRHQNSDIDKSAIHEFIDSKLSKQDKEIFGLTYHEERITSGVALRSSKIASFKPSLQAKIQATLNELGIAVKPTMPTKRTIEEFDKLIQAINVLLDAKKSCDKLETEINLIKAQQDE